MRNKLYILTMLFGFLGNAVFAYDPGGSLLPTPGDLVSEAHRTGKTFSDISELFIPVLKKTASDNTSSVVKLRLDSEIRKQLSASKPEYISFSVPLPEKGGSIQLEAVAVNFLSDDFLMEDQNHNRIPTDDMGVHWQGIVKGNSESTVTISLVDAVFYAIVDIPGEGAIVISPPDMTGSAELRVERKDPLQGRGFFCNTPDTDLYSSVSAYKEKLSSDLTTHQSSLLPICVRVGYEFDVDWYEMIPGVPDHQKKGRVRTIAALVFNSIAPIFAREGINLQFSYLKIWTVQDPFSTPPDVGDLIAQQNAVLDSYSSYYQNHPYPNVHALQLWSAKRYHGIENFLAKLDLSSSFGLAKISQVGSNRSVSLVSYIPPYVLIAAPHFLMDILDWSITSVHEFGHTFGSEHTHACKWNENDTALDSWYTVEGHCNKPGELTNEEGAGGIMSYKHLSDRIELEHLFTFGIIKEAKAQMAQTGFGRQPRDAMLKTIHGNNLSDIYCPGLQYRIRNLNSNQYMAVADNVESSYIVQQPKNKSKSQLWEIIIPVPQAGTDPHERIWLKNVYSGQYLTAPGHDFISAERGRAKQSQSTSMYSNWYLVLDNSGKKGGYKISFRNYNNNFWDWGDDRLEVENGSVSANAYISLQATPTVSYNDPAMPPNYPVINGTSEPLKALWILEPVVNRVKANDIVHHEVIQNTAKNNDVQFTENQLQDIELYPNPAQDTFTVRSHHAEIQSILIYSIHNRIVWQKDAVHAKEHSIDVRNFMPGLYTVRVETANRKILTKRLIVE